ncbi:unnamed protein product [Closterium sp. NIES-64]|nr:unnamed protein product [Closterium sp. NIES-64]
MPHNQEVALLDLGALPLEVLLLTSLELGVVLVPEVLVLELLELLGLEVLLSLGVLLLETLRLETLGLEVPVLGVLLLVELVVEELALRVVELLEVLSLPSSTGLPLQPGSPLPAPSPYTEQTGGLTERQPESDRTPTAHPTVTRLLATVVTNPSFESAAASALVTELVDFAAACRLDYTASLVAESESLCPPSVGGECALGTDVLEDRHEDLECLAAAAPHLVSMVLALEGDLDAPDIPTPRFYAEAIAGEYSSQ